MSQDQVDDSDEEDNVDVSIKFPKGDCDKLFYMIFFPLHVIIWLMPNYHKEPSIKKLALCFMLNTILQTFMLYLIDWFMFIFCFITEFPVQIIGAIYTGILFSVPFFMYNYRFAKKEKSSVDFLNSFI